MPYADSARQREYQRRWWNQRRTEWIASHGPCAACGTRQDLEVDHIDPATKLSHNVWSWSKRRRAEELAKCQVLCGTCHSAKTFAAQRKSPEHGTWRCYGRGCREQECRAAWAAYRRTLKGRSIA